MLGHVYLKQMYDDSRTCWECGKTKPAKQFWQEAKRCRKCVARATGKRRTERAKEWKSRVKKEYGLSFALSETRVGRERAEANRVAESTVPKSDRDTWAKWLAIYGAVATPGSAILGCIAIAFQNGYPMLWVSFLTLASGLVSSGVAGKLRVPRDTVVIDLTNALLRDRLKLVEAELMEYLRFYTTPDWRAMRAKVIRQEGRICRKCGVRIGRWRDVTVDHIRPRSLYPQLALDPNNLQVLCRSCNSSKGVSVQTEQ